MNREYAKFNQVREDYNPRVTEESHFSNYPDVLIPSDYEEVGGDPIREQLSTLLLRRQTPPGTPPEEEPGQAGCHIFQDSGEHYVAPIYENKLHRRIFATKLILGHLCFYIPSFILLITISIWRKAEHEIFEKELSLASIFGASLALGGLYVYFVGLFRNPPNLYLAYFFRALVTTGIFGVGSLLFCVIFLRQVLGYDLHLEEDEKNRRNRQDENGEQQLDEFEDKGESIDEENYTHSSPYLGIVIIMIEAFVQIVNSFLFIKYKYDVNDYRIPFVIYTTCYATLATTTTLALNGIFYSDPVAYDIFQIIVGCMFAGWHLMGTPDFLERLFKGKVCPLREDETGYALLHFGM